MKAIIIVLSLTLSACAALELSEEYEGVRGEKIIVDKQPFVVFANADQKRLWVQDTIGTSIVKGFAEGLTLGALDTDGARKTYEPAALSWLQSKGGTNCRILDAQPIPDAGFEFTYACEGSQVSTFISNAITAPKKKKNVCRQDVLEDEYRRCRASSDVR